MKIVIQGQLTDLNSYIEAERSNKFAASSIKKTETTGVAWQCKLKEKIKEYPVHIDFHWYTKDLRVDPDNTAFSRKFILDGMVQAGILENDGRKQISGFSDTFYVDKLNPRTEVVIT